MKTDVIAPSVGESITEVSILKWHKLNGEAVKKGDVLLEIESDKATVEIVADSAGTLLIQKQAGEKIPIGAVIGAIDDSAAPTATAAVGASAKALAPAPAPSGVSGPGTSGANPSLSPAVKKIVEENGVDPSRVAGSGKDGRLTKGDVLTHLSAAPAAVATAVAPAPARATPAPAPVISLPMKPGDRRVPMTRLRAKIAERLVHAQHTAAILTTFNECDLTAVMKLRKEYKDKFQAKYGVGLSFMSFFTRASVLALQAVPEVNAAIDGSDVVYHDYQDIGIAVGTERGLVVPVVVGAEKMGFVDIEKKIGELAKKARDGKLSIADMTGGTFTISNGGTYGSLLSTPILNPPQSGILGMHKIMDRPMAVEGNLEIRPMMYLALSYDHRIIDGKGAVTFLIKVKEGIENPESLGLEEIRGL